jgi:MFS transporter, UMF1 family
MRPRRRERWAWYLYDFGNSAYAAVVLLAVYATYFKNQVVGGARGSWLWGLSIGIAMLVVALSSPMLGAIADFSASKKRFLFLATTMSCLFTALLFFTQQGTVFMGMLFFILAEIGYRSAQVFYDALLPELATPEEIGGVSGTGWAIGSAGGIVCLLIILPLVVLIKGPLMVRLAMPIAAAFFATSAIPIFLWLRERAQSQPLPPGETYLTIGFRRLWRTIQAARHYGEFLKFMAAFLIFNDGIIMALDFAAIIGAVLFGVNQQQLILLMILLQATSVAGAWVFGRLADRVGCKRTLVLTLFLMLGCVAWLFVTTSVLGFFLVGALAGFALTGVQSVSRTLVATFSPPGRSAEFFGFFAVAGRTSSFIGPTVYGLVASRAANLYQLSGQSVKLAEQSGQRIAILSILVFLLVGLALLALVNEKRGRAAAEADENAV